jgi:polyisoprenoid-binding protein YceI
MKRILGAALCGMMMIGAATADILKVDKEKSRIHVDGKSTGHSFTGTLEDYTAKVSGDASKLDPTAFELSWKFSELKTADDKRDKNMIAWLGGGTPKGSFKFVKTWEKGGQKYASGNLTINGVSKTISFPYTVKKKGSWISIDGTATLDYQNFKLPLIRALAVMTVDPKLTVRFHVVGEL